MVDNYLKIFNNFPPKIKKLMNKEMENFKQLKNTEFLGEQLRKIGIQRLLK